MRYRFRTLLIVLAIGSMVFAQEVRDLREALYGEWEVVEMIYQGKVQDFGIGPGGWMKFEKYSVAIAQKDHRYLPASPCTIRQNEMDIRENILGMESSLKAMYELKGDKLRIVWRDDYGERPKDFDALTNPKLTLYVLKRVK